MRVYPQTFGYWLYPLQQQLLLLHLLGWSSLVPVLVPAGAIYHLVPPNEVNSYAWTIVLPIPPASAFSDQSTMDVAAIREQHIGRGGQPRAEKYLKCKT